MLRTTLLGYPPLWVQEFDGVCLVFEILPAVWAYSYMYPSSRTFFDSKYYMVAIEFSDFQTKGMVGFTPGERESLRPQTSPQSAR